jgi:hypothetical protein
MKIEIPEKMLLRRGEVKTALGVSKWELEKLVETNILRPVHLREGARAYFRQCDVVALINKEMV